MADKDDLDPNLPGLDAFEGYFEILFKGWEKQKSTWNNAWNEIRKGDYTFQELARDYAQSYQNQFRVAEQLARFPVARMLDAEVPAWVNFDLREDRLTTKITLNNLIKKANTREFNRQKVKLTVTELDPFGANDYRFKIKAEELRSDQVRITILSLKQNNREVLVLDSDQKAEELKNLRDAGGISGQYLGMVFDVGSDGPPFAVVTLAI